MFYIDEAAIMELKFPKFWVLFTEVGGGGVFTLIFVLFSR